MDLLWFTGEWKKVCSSSLFSFSSSSFRLCIFTAGRSWMLFFLSLNRIWKCCPKYRRWENFLYLVRHLWDSTLWLSVGRHRRPAWDHFREGHRTSGKGFSSKIEWFSLVWVLGMLLAGHRCSLKMRHGEIRATAWPHKYAFHVWEMYFSLSGFLEWLGQKPQSLDRWNRVPGNQIKDTGDVSEILEKINGMQFLFSIKSIERSAWILHGYCNIVYCMDGGIAVYVKKDWAPQ